MSNALIDGLEVHFLQNGSPFPSDNPAMVVARATTTAGGNNDIFLHPSITRTNGEIDLLEGFDIAMLGLDHVPSHIPGYDLYSGDPLGRIGIIAGYGAFGHGSLGDSGQVDYRKRFGLNMFEAHPEFTDHDVRETMIGMDFEEPGNPDSSFWDDFNTVGLGSLESLPGPGDSGAPTFLNTGGGSFAVAGIHSFGRGNFFTDQVPGPDPFIDPTNASWGDIGVSANIAHPEVWAWIHFQALGVRVLTASPTPEEPSTQDLSNPDNWYNDALPGPTESASVQIGGSFEVFGPTSGETLAFRELTVGGDTGTKLLSMVGGGSLVLADRLALPKGVQVNHFVGAIEAPEIVIGGDFGEEVAAFQWSDFQLLGTSTLTANQIVVGNRGIFFDDWLDRSTGTLSAIGGGRVGLLIEAGGEVFVEADADEYGGVVNRGLFSLGRHLIGNAVTVDSYAQEAGAGLDVFVASDGVAMHQDRLVVRGTATLDGTLFINPVDPGLVQVFDIGDQLVVLTADLIEGEFDFVSGTVITDFLEWVVETSLTEVALRAAPVLRGDLTLDGFVGAGDLDVLLGKWNQTVDPWSSPDLNGDGFVGAGDLDVLLGNWNASLPPAVTLVPEPGVGLVALAGLFTTRRRALTRSGPGGCGGWRSR